MKQNTPRSSEAVQHHRSSFFTARDSTLQKLSLLQRGLTWEPTSDHPEGGVAAFERIRSTRILGPAPCLPAEIYFARAMGVFRKSPVRDLSWNLLTSNISPIFLLQCIKPTQYKTTIQLFLRNTSVGAARARISPPGGQYREVVGQLEPGDGDAVVEGVRLGLRDARLLLAQVRLLLGQAHVLLQNGCVSAQSQHPQLPHLPPSGSAPMVHRCPQLRQSQVAAQPKDGSFDIPNAKRKSRCWRLCLILFNSWYAPDL